MSCMTGSIIKQFREKVGLTQAELARALEVSAVTVNRWENDDPRYKPSEKDIRLIEAATEILEAMHARSDSAVAEMRDALRVSSMAGLVGAGAVAGVIGSTSIGILAATPGLGWLGLISGVGIGITLPFFKKLRDRIKR